MKKALGLGLAAFSLILTIALVMAGGGVRNLILNTGYENAQCTDANTCTVDLFMETCRWGDIVITNVKFDGINYDSGEWTGSCSSSGYSGKGAKYYKTGVTIPSGTTDHTFYVGGPCSGHHGQSCWDNETNPITINPEDHCVSDTEICGDNIDNDCDGDIDENCGSQNTYYLDSDGDSFGNPSISIIASTLPFGYSTNANDCNDNNANINPLASDANCDGVDNNCNILIDEGYAPTSTACGLGLCASTGALACIGGTVFDSCSMGAPSTETCDGFDNNCDGTIDEGCTTNTYFLDSDGDTYGDSSNSVQGNSAPTGYVTNGNDCNDNDATINPTASDTNCDGIDNNCNLLIDESYVTSPTSCGLGVCASTGLLQCILGVPTDSCIAGTPGTVEICGDNIDNNCDGQADENCGPGFCTTNTDCTDDYYGNKYCKGDDVYKKLHDFTCTNNTCDENITEEFVKTCKYSCKDGKCKGGGGGGGDDDDEDKEIESINYFVGGEEPQVGQVLISLSGNNPKSTQSQSNFWFWFILLIIGIILLFFIIVWALSR